MKALQLKQGGLNLTDVTIPECKEFEIILDLKFCGICGSDINNIFGTSSKPTKKIGHEISGVISKIGSKITDFKVGDRVTINHHAPCEVCHYCTHGNQTMCSKFSDQLIPCGISEKILITEWIIRNKGIFKLPNNVSFEEGAIIEPLACCLRAWKKLGKTHPQSVAIFGLGAIGLLHACLAKLFGFKEILGFDINEYRRDFFIKNLFGKLVKPDFIEDDVIWKTKTMVDFCIIATSDLSCLTHAINLVRNGGTILIFGEPSLDYKLNIEISKIYEKEISIFTSYAATNIEFKESIELVTQGQINVKKLITHKFPINDSLKAIDFTRDGAKNIKVLISCNQES